MASWTFLTNQALVLIHIGRRPDSTGLEIAAAVGITERAVRKILAELQAAGYLEAERIGRRNRYRVDVHRQLRHAAERELTVGELLALVPARPSPFAMADGTTNRQQFNREGVGAGSSQLVGVNS
jgi:predicted ArsR family transcriptional regulator